MLAIAVSVETGLRRQPWRSRPDAAAARAATGRGGLGSLDLRLEPEQDRADRQLVSGLEPRFLDATGR